VSKSEVIDQRQIEGHAFLLLQEAMLFLRRHLPVAGRIVPGLFEQKDELLFPLEAFLLTFDFGWTFRNWKM
jgi:ATP-dependent DNA helicase RecG